MALSLLGLLAFGREWSYLIASIANFPFLMQKKWVVHFADVF